MATIQEMRALRAKIKESQENAGKKGDANQLYKHWDIPTNSSVTLRFLPDANKDNPWYWAERQMISIKFAGIKNDPSAGEVTVKVPCVEMYGIFGHKMDCPIMPDLRAWFKSKDPSLVELGRQYWPKKDFILQGFVRGDNPAKDDQQPENPIRSFMLSKKLGGKLIANIDDEETIASPSDYEQGLDFVIKKGKSGEFANYDESGFKKRESALTAAEREAIEKYGLNDLEKFLPKRPDAASLIAIREMFDVSVDGGLYDVERWGNFYKPYGVEFKQPSAPQPTAQADADDEAKTPESGDAPWENTAQTPVVPEVNKPAMKSDITDRLAAIRNRGATPR